MTTILTNYLLLFHPDVSDRIALIVRDSGVTPVRIPKAAKVSTDVMKERGFPFPAMLDCIQASASDMRRYLDAAKSEEEALAS